MTPSSPSRLPLLAALCIGTRRWFQPLATLLVLACCSCGGSSPAKSIEKGNSALSTNSPIDALRHFNAALCVLHESNASYPEAKLGQLRALCYVDLERVKDGLAEYTAIEGFEPRPCDYRLLAVDLYTAARRQTSGWFSLEEEDYEYAEDSLALALDILSKGRLAFPDDDKWGAIAQKVQNKMTEFATMEATLKRLCTVRCEFDEDGNHVRCNWGEE